MGSQDIGKKVTEKVGFVQWLQNLKTHNFASDHASSIILVSL